MAPSPRLDSCARIYWYPCWSSLLRCWEGRGSITACGVQAGRRLSIAGTINANVIASRNGRSTPSLSRDSLKGYSSLQSQSCSVAFAGSHLLVPPLQVSLDVHYTSGSSSLLKLCTSIRPKPPCSSLNPPCGRGLETTRLLFSPLLQALVYPCTVFYHGHCCGPLSVRCGGSSHTRSPMGCFGCHHLRGWKDRPRFMLSISWIRCATAGRWPLVGLMLTFTQFLYRSPFSYPPECCKLALRLLRSLCGSWGVLPTSYTLHIEVRLFDEHPFVCSRGAEVFRGKLNGEPVAVKALTNPLSDDSSRLNKVGIAPKLPPSACIKLSTV